MYTRILLAYKNLSSESVNGAYQLAPHPKSYDRGTLLKVLLANSVNTALTILWLAYPTYWWVRPKVRNLDGKIKHELKEKFNKIMFENCMIMKFLVTTAIFFKICQKII